ncbi:hypothetical protein ABPG77_005723 [Micractinium sp. CCAP 211/92]
MPCQQLVGVWNTNHNLDIPINYRTVFWWAGGRKGRNRPISAPGIFGAMRRLATALALAALLHIGGAESTGIQCRACKPSFEGRAACAQYSTNSTCSPAPGQAGPCAWWPENNMASLIGTVPLDGLLPEAYAGLVDLTQAADACYSMVVSPTCTDTCRAFLAKLPLPADFLANSLVTGEVCKMSTCANGTSVCWESDAQLAAKLLFSHVVRKCVSPEAATCFPAGGRCVAADYCSAQAATSTDCEGSLVPGTSTKAYCRFDPTCSAVGGTGSVLAYPPTMPIITASQPASSDSKPPPALALPSRPPVNDSKPPPSLAPPSRPPGNDSKPPPALAPPSRPPGNNSKPPPALAPPSRPPGNDSKPPPALAPPSRPQPSAPTVVRTDGPNTMPPAAPSPLPPPSPLAVDPCEGSNDTCCRRAGSFSACELDSLPADGCTYFGTCQPAEPSLCYSQTNQSSCSEKADFGCTWTPYDSPTAPPAAPTAPWQGQPPQETFAAPPAAPPAAPAYPAFNETYPGLEAWPVPQLPPSYFSDPRQWWNQPRHGDHGPFDLLTPALADRLAAAGVPDVLCGVVDSVLAALSRDGASLQDACTSTAICSATPTPLSQLLASFGVAEEHVCGACRALAEAAAALPQANLTGTVPAILRQANASGAIAAVSRACPSTLGGLLWAAQHYEQLHDSMEYVIAADVCPALAAVAGRLTNQTWDELQEACAALGGGAACSVARSLLGGGAGSAGNSCLTMLPVLLRSGSSYSGPSYSPPYSPGSWTGPNPDQQSQLPYDQTYPGLEAWPVPQLPPSYFSDPRQWWNQPRHGDHGPFDLLTPALADRLAAAGAVTPMCDALSDAVTLAAANLSSVCDAANLCSATQASWLGDVLSLVGTTQKTACAVCRQLTAVAIGELKSEGVADEVQQFVRLGEQLLANVTEACPSVLGGLFWIAQHYDVLPSVGQPLATLLCPTLARAVSEAGPELLAEAKSICNQLAGTTVCNTAFALLAGSEAFLNATCSLLLPALIDDSRCAASPKPATLPTTTLTELPAGPE